MIASVQHALNILNVFGGGRAELGNNDLAKLLAMDPGTVAGLVYTLKVNGYLDQNPDTRKYRLGLKLAERAAELLNQIDLRKIASPALEQLREWSGESVNLAVRDHKEVVYIERLFGHHSLGIRSELGKRGHLHSTALGKAILANMPPADAAAILADYEFVQVTAKTITDAKAFHEELEKVRRAGYAIDEEENELGGRCLAAPIFDATGSPVAAVSISVPVQRLPHETVPEYGNKVMEASLAISRSMGYFPTSGGRRSSDIQSASDSRDTNTINKN